VPQLFRDGTIKLDVAFINCSMPDENGYVSFGVSADITPAAVECAKVIIAQINPLMPFTYGDSVIHMSRIDALVKVNDPLAETSDAAPTEKELKIGRYIAEQIPDGACCKSVSVASPMLCSTLWVRTSILDCTPRQ
jgi:acyl-CoA hydrolase